MDRGAWRAAVHGVTEGRTRLRRLSRAHAPGDGDTGEGPGRGRRKGGGTEASAGARPGIPAEGRELGSWPAVPIPRGRVSGGVAALACPSWLISARSESPGSGQDGRQPRVRPIRPLTAQLPPPLSPSAHAEPAGGLGRRPQMAPLQVARRLCRPTQGRERCGFSPWVGKIAWSRKWQPTPAFLLLKSRRQRSLAGYSP